MLKRTSTNPWSALSQDKQHLRARRMGHAGAIISGGQGTAADKMAALEDAGIHVCESPAEMGATMKRTLSG